MVNNPPMKKQRVNSQELADLTGESIYNVRLAFPSLKGYKPATVATVPVSAVEQFLARRGKGRPRKVKPGATAPAFPVFWFDGNAFFGWVRSPDDLANLEQAYPGGQWRKALRCDASTDRPNFGFRIEHSGGSVSLGEWLEQSEIR